MTQKSARKVKTPAEVRRQFNRIGKSITAWAAENGFERKLVYAVLAGRAKGLRGNSHKIAVLLGLKDGVIEKRTLQ